MLFHITCFTLTETADREAFAQGLHALGQTLTTPTDFWCGEVIGESLGADVVAVIALEDEGLGLDAFLAEPGHRQFLGQFSQQIVEMRSIDFVPLPRRGD